MSIPEIIQELEAERDRLSQAISALRNGRNGSRRDKPAKRFVSQAARRRISDALKRKWAERKRSAQ